MVETMGYNTRTDETRDNIGNEENQGLHRVRFTIRCSRPHSTVRPTASRLGIVVGHIGEFSVRDLGWCYYRWFFWSQPDDDKVKVVRAAMGMGAPASSRRGMCQFEIKRPACLRADHVVSVAPMSLSASEAINGSVAPFLIWRRIEA